MGPPIIVGVAVVLAVMIIGVYDGLVSGQQRVRNAWSQIDIQ